MIKVKAKKVTLAIGDGNNDFNMIKKLSLTFNNQLNKVASC